MVLSLIALALTEKERVLEGTMGKLEEGCWENPSWKNGELEEASENLVKGKEVELILGWLKWRRGVKKVEEKAMEAICVVESEISLNLFGKFDFQVNLWMGKSDVKVG